jgi:SNF2 family DNA or RNA helicase
MTAPATVATRKSLEPWIRDDVPYYQHQIEGVRQLVKLKSFLLSDEMGLGKSLTAITVFTIDVKRGWSSKCLVVCPATLKGNWADELEKWTRFPFVVLNGTPFERNAQLLNFIQMDGPRFLIINYDLVATHLDVLNNINFDAVIFDEAHKLKNPEAKRTKACLDLMARRSFMLTGTPMLNHVDELWSLMHRVQPERWPNYFAFRSKYCVFGGYRNKQIVGKKKEHQLIAALSEIQLRRLAKDVLDLPEVQIIDRRVDLTDEQRELYDQAIEDLQLPDPNSATPMDIENGLVKFLRLKQICGTALPFLGKDISSKLDLACDDDSELLENGHRIVVWTQFREVLRCYANRMEKLGVPVFQIHGDVPVIERPNVIKSWAMTKTPGVIACMLQVGGEGLNMTQSRHGSFLDKLFVPGGNAQAIKRQHRIGADKTQPVQIREYKCRNTIETVRIEQILRTKIKLNDEIIDYDPNYKKELYKALMERQFQ